MKSPTRNLILILAVVALALWIDLNDTLTIRNPFDQKIIFQRDVRTVLGLDLRGGLQVLLEADVPENQAVSADDMSIARQILENRTNALGVSESVLQVAGERRIVGEFPGVENPDEIMGTLGQTGLLEFVDLQTEWLPAGTPIRTDYGLPTPSQPDFSLPVEERIYHTVLTGADLDSKRIQVSTNQLTGEIVVDIAFKGDAVQVFSDYTTTHVNQYLAIVLDGQIISAPRVSNPIPDGSGYISGAFTAEEANQLAITLRYGALPIPFKVVESRLVGPTLGQDSLRRSLIAGLIGLAVVFLFMAIYYRLPGLLADIAIVVYALVAFAVFKYIPVTLTLAGVAGFLLSTGAALDANILIFERMKEELRAGRNLRQAIDLGWTRAWSSIRDSNIATLITSGILFWFGSAFGATIVKGFSFTLAIGVVISLFTALLVTRTLLALVLTFMRPDRVNLKWFGVEERSA